MLRKYIDCRDYPNDVNCSLRISGEEDEVVRAAVDHSVSVHGAQNTSELRDQIRSGLKDEPEQHGGTQGVKAGQAA